MLAALYSVDLGLGPQGGSCCRHAEPANREFCTAVTEWAFRERGVLRASNVRHHLSGHTQQPEAYRVSDDLVFSLDIAELVRGIWQPYQ